MEPTPPQSGPEPTPETGKRPAIHWRSLLGAVLAGLALVAIVVSTGVLWFSSHSQKPPTEMEAQFQLLRTQVQELRQEQQMPSLVLNRYRNSICYIFGVYHVSFRGKEAHPALRAHVAGTGFMVADGLLATNRHVAEPWYGDPEAQALIRRGGEPGLDKLLAYFPGMPTPIAIDPVVVSPLHDLAIVRMETAPETPPAALPLAAQLPAPGELVTVIGYPLGVAGMVAKSPQAVYERLAFRKDDAGAASELAALSLIRPSATYGHLGDIVGSKLVYDAPTAHGGSGGPVIDSHGNVIGINTAYMDGFSGGTLGISVVALKPMVDVARQAK